MFHTTSAVGSLQVYTSSSISNQVHCKSTLHFYFQSNPKRGLSDPLQIRQIGSHYLKTPYPFALRVSASSGPLRSRLHPLPISVVFPIESHHQIQFSGTRSKPLQRGQQHRKVSINQFQICSLYTLHTSCDLIRKIQ